MPTATINGMSMNWTDNGTGRPLVLMHGFPLDARMWREQVEGLSSRFRVIAPDFRGFGKSANEGPFTLDQLADDVHALVQHLKLGPVALAGLSMGGYVALAYVTKYPATLSSLLLIDTKAEADGTEARQNRDRMIAIAKEKGSKPIAEAMLGKLIAEETAKSRPAIGRQLREMMEDQKPASIAHALAAMRNRPDRTEMLASIAVPTLVIVGEKDAVTPVDVAKKMAERIPRAEFKIVPGVGHMSPVEDAETVNREILRFLQG
jgi:pimeloyl-ACP methyl ester carboxylesterase